MEWSDYFKIAHEGKIHELVQTNIMVDFTRDRELEPDIRELTSKMEFIGFEVGLAALVILLFKYTKQEHITLGVCCNDDSEVISFTIDKDESISKLLDNSKSILKNSRKATAVVYNPYDGDLWVDFAMCFEGNKVKILYDKNLWDDITISRLEKNYRIIANLIYEKRNYKIKDVNFITDEEKNIILNNFSHNDARYPQNKTIVDLFEEQVKKNPDNIAVKYENESITYRELNERSNAVAIRLRKLGVKPCDFVAILAQRSIEMVVGIYGIVKSGGAYVPINPEYPEDRINYILNDCCPKAILTYNAGTDVNGIPTIDMRDDDIVRGNSENPVHVNSPKDILYVIYTSGTTGNPKGVMIEHVNVVRLLFNDKFQFDFDSNDVWTMFHSCCFDVSVWEMYGATLYGGKLVVVSSERVKNGKLMIDLIVNEKVTVLNQVPSSFYSLISLDVWNKKDNLRYLIFAGEALSPKRLKEWKDNHPNVKIVNMYGITETTVHSTYKEIGYEEIQKGISDIGSAIPTLGIYIMDGMNLCGIGMPGELCVVGEGVARGYLNRPGLTAEKFIEDPFKGGRLYRSGDLARWMPNGNIEYLGRIDQQVKIRGFRIELGEIEAQLLKHNDIRQVAVIAVDIEGTKELAAYIVATCELSVGELREFLGDKLPYYMIPGYYVQLESIPVNHNGKLDRRALPNPVGKMRTGSEYIEATTEEEKIMAEILKKVLNVSEVSVLDNFFDLGGNSLLAETVCALANEKGIAIEVSDIFKKGCISKILELRGETINNQFDLVQDMYNLKEVDNLTEIKGKDAISIYNISQYKSKAELPAVAQNDITTYLHRSLPLCAIMAHENYKGWVYSNYTQIFSYRDARGFLEINYLEPRDSFADISDVICLGYHLLKDIDNVVEFIKEKIQFGYYLILHLDEYELSNKNNYMKNHYVHASIVYGYDDETRQIKGIGFDKGRLFNDLIFDYDEINKAFLSSKIHYINHAPWCAWSAVQLMKFKSPDKKFPFSKKKFMRDLSEYIHSISDEYRLFSFEYDVNRVNFGINVYDDLVKELKNILNGQFNVDYRALHIISEHKKCLFDRIAYVIEKYNLSAELINKNKQFYEVFLQFEELRTKFLGQIFQEFNLGQLSKKQKNVIEKSSDQILKIKEVEYKLLNEIHELLSLEL